MLNRCYLLVCLICCFSFDLFAQNPIPAVGPWSNSGQPQSVTVHNLGVGVLNPDGKAEIKYQPCGTQQNGLVVTSIGCNNLNQVYNAPPADGLLYFDLNTPIPPKIELPQLVFGASFGVTTSLVPLVDINKKPMLWVRDENPASIINPNAGITYTTKFIVLPNGNTGINTSNPRAPLDVVQFKGDKNNDPTAVFGKIAKGTQTPLIGGEGGAVNSGVFGYRTSQIIIYNSLSEKSYNRIVQDEDQGIFFSDGNNSDGSNKNGALVIAPWAADYKQSQSNIGGIRIDKQGNVEVHGNLRATKLTINTKWWSDFVFADDYKLLSIEELSEYIRINRVLPGFQKENEILSNGLSVSDILGLQQQKIEELTLYIIDLQNQINNLLKTSKN